MNNINKLPNVKRLYRGLKEHFTARQWHVWEGLLGLFLSVEEATHLKNVKVVSSSSASRLLKNYTETEQLKRCLWQFQAAALRHYATKQGRNPWLVLRVDLTSIAKCGKQLPYVRTYNGVHGIHLVVLHVSLGNLSLPMGCEIYDPASNATPSELALKLLKQMHPYAWGDFQQLVLMDAGFYSAQMLDRLTWWGFKHISIGARANLRLSDGRTLRQTRQAEAVVLDSLPGSTFYVAWLTLPRDGKSKRFYTLSNTRATAKTLTHRHKRRWRIESFFKSAKHDFGLQQTRLRSKQGIANWLLLVWLSSSLALFSQALHGKTKHKYPAWRLTLAQAAEYTRDYLIPRWFHLRVLIALSKCPLAARRFALVIEYGKGV